MTAVITYIFNHYINPNTFDIATMTNMVIKPMISISYFSYIIYPYLLRFEKMTVRSNTHISSYVPAV